MNVTRNIEIEGENGRPILIDTLYQETSENLPVIIFCHGFKGFKDWGAWDLMGLAFARSLSISTPLNDHGVEGKAGYLFIKFNYSHNGGTKEQPIDFPDLEAFGNNNYSIELRDTKRVLDWLKQSDLPATNDITLIGHSRAGGIATIVASKDHRVTRLVTMASVAHYDQRFPQGEELQKWKQNGVYYIKNGRTQQEMPLYYQFYEDFQRNSDQLNIIKAARNLKVPHLIIHGDADPTVAVQDSHDLKAASLKSELRILRGTDHVFGASHPWDKDHLPADLRQVVQCVLNFIDA
ncbi:alpha/beta hydrolase [Nonlabens spongiae]|uniref:Alpha/beta hydrolase n=1 Tax=Nonlabens spongiae TaxID=331648 RepID=A0A1W6MPE2_9FLAO|nr:alpha/beta fold hydrolase [Nonlabens spongiae]ARN79447.1 alpha/beta hydrolase [Nonlabens spongiae]